MLAPATRAIGMGLFFTVFYACMMLGPVIGGACAKWAARSAAAFDLRAAVILACPLVLWGLTGSQWRRRSRRDCPHSVQRL